jgi:hypothetical protein
MTRTIEINCWNWDGHPRIHSGAWHFVARRGCRAYDPASLTGLLDPGFSQYEDETDVVDATQ